jgi:hypothetical protein
VFGAMPRALLGVNIPYFYGAYGHDLAPSARFPDWPCSFDLLRAYRPLLEAKAIGLDAVRVWLCEGAEGLLHDERGRLRGPHPQLLESIALLEEGAAVAGVRIYWSLLDANAASRDGDELTRALLTDPDEGARFAELVVAPIARRLDPRVLVGLEIINEPEVVTESCRDMRPANSLPSIPWERLGAMIAQARAAALAERADLVVTAGTGNAFLPKLWHSGAGLTAIDIHVYHAEGGLPSRADLARYVGDPAIASEQVPLIAGECGAPKPDHDEHALRNYLINADSRSYSAAFLWKLEGDLVQDKLPNRPLTDTAKQLHNELKARPPGGFVSDR